MLEIRYFEEKVWDLLVRDIAKGAAHLYAGEEAVAVGAVAATRTDDYVASTHRGHGHCIAKGADLGKTMAEILGKSEEVEKFNARLRQVKKRKDGGWRDCFYSARSPLIDCIEAGGRRC
jgi:TPP-dependent pyruvate/acetoin dehydrogenase alpha subunit